MRDSLYPLVLSLHSALRWVVLGAGVWAVARPAAGWVAARPWTSPDARAPRHFATALDLQVTLGLLLYGVLSPVTRAAFAGGAATLARAAEVRFFTVVHLACMLAALVLAHAGAVTARRASATPPRVQHGRALVWAALALGAVAAGVPWWRPFYRAFL